MLLTEYPIHTRLYIPRARSGPRVFNLFPIDRLSLI